MNVLFFKTEVNVQDKFLSDVSIVKDFNYKYLKKIYPPPTALVEVVMVSFSHPTVEGEAGSLIKTVILTGLLTVVGRSAEG